MLSYSNQQRHLLLTLAAHSRVSREELQSQSESGCEGDPLAPGTTHTLNNKERDGSASADLWKVAR